jgi:RimJ/RimL family protein N-acetyltransferase
MPILENALPGLPLKGRRITIRVFNLADEARRQAWAKFDEPYFSRYNFTSRRPKANLILFERLRDRIRLALDDADQELIGYAALKPAGGAGHSMELSLCFGADRVGQGWGREALELLLPWAIESLNLRRIILDVDVINQRALRLYRGLGFTVSGQVWKKEKNPRIAEFAKQIGLEPACRCANDRIEILTLRMEWSPTRPDP